MAINKKLIHFNNFSNFNSKKLSANVENTKYTIGIEGSILNGEPEILYQSIVYIKDVLQLWTHGLIYDCSEAGFIPGEGEGSAILNGATDCSATGKNSIAGGRLAFASGENSVALGRSCEASGRSSIALGGYISGIKLTGPANSLVYTTTNYISQDLIGYSIYLVDSTFNNKVATITNIQGNFITVDKTLSLNAALDNKQFVILSCKATGNGAVALGMAYKAEGLASLAEGLATIALGENSHAEGYMTISAGENSHTEGRHSKTLGMGSHAEGASLAIGQFSHSEGGHFASIYLTGNNKIYTIEKGTNIQNSFFFVQKLINLNIIDPNTSNTVATIINAVIEEDNYTVTIELDLDLGLLMLQLFAVYQSVAVGESSHSECYGYAVGDGSHAGGWSTANGINSFSHGDSSTASGRASTVFGTNNYSQNNSEFSLGRSNRSHNGETDADKTLFSVGCGLFSEISMDTRIANKIPLPTPEDGTNALEIMQNGDVWLGTYNEGHKIWDNVNKKVCNAWSILEEDPFNGHEYVDLGLPSGTLWATSVIGGDNPLYFQWGDIEGWTVEQINNGEKVFADSDYKWNDGSSMTKYNATDGKTVLDLEDDAAHVHMGGDWHMPTKEQLEELTANTTSAWTTQNDVSGRLFTSTINGESVFVPAFGTAYDGSLYDVGSGGCVWGSSVSERNLSGAWYLGFGSSSVGMDGDDRTYGLCVLGVI